MPGCRGTLSRRLVRGVVGPPVPRIDPVMLDSIVTASSCGRPCCVPVYHWSTHYLFYYFPSIHTFTPLRTRGR
ncbi:hypothetical protein PAXRUDRAFT_829156 [Paxillus rubicundulus Ve08.2h10]|uniref:Uncharacterized protein n=1 Tax=Paxillus rubicundulus Ve08.2h10 TaxID=930991 RepID=A0A0D0E0F1_9AGAM|nr:hypothetical protein PAXRUDRAFT_829156 [Paxillus rubicundulus Ve08.2h10]